MSIIWNHLTQCQNDILSIFDQYCEEYEEPGLAAFNQPHNGWVNRVYCNQHVRRAHIDVVDARETRGLWMMHVCVFPALTNDAPIYGFDVIAGKNKITGCFIDYSPTTDQDHPMLTYFADEVSGYTWIKKRELPEWAQRIFSAHMVAAGNISSESELDQVENLAKVLVTHWLETVGKTNYSTPDSTSEQNYYAQNQKQNPHTPKVMTSLGLDENDVRTFIQECLFPEI